MVDGGGASLKITGLSKSYASSVALDGIDLDVRPGEFMTLLGPSGSGKTTTLNLVAGFIEADSGEILMDEKSLGGIPPYRRNIGVVFQNYALFPHMRVSANVAYALRQRRVPKVEIERRVGEILEIVGLEGYSNRYPRELSGGQQQRVALARALIFRPKLLLLDEPLGALDKRLRENLQTEIKRIHREVGVTFLFVTHDQEEALAMSDRIVVFNKGRIEQIGTAKELYEKPETLFVSRFLGDSNVVEGKIINGGEVFTDGEGNRFILPKTELSDGEAFIVIRPERTKILPADAQISSGFNSLSGVVFDMNYLGSHRRVVVDVGAKRFLVDESVMTDSVNVGDRVWVTWMPSDSRIVTRVTSMI